MLPTLVLSLALSPGVDVRGGARDDPLGPLAYPPVYVPAEAPTGYLYEPVMDLHTVPWGAATKYAPKAGDILLLSDPDPLFNVLYRIARSGKPGHCAGCHHAGRPTGCDGGRVQLHSLGSGHAAGLRDEPLCRAHLGTPARVPLTPEEDRRLTEFAMLADGGKYNLRSFAMQTTLIRTRNPIISRFAGKPVGPGHEYHCVQIVVEALVYAGLVDERTARPKATLAQDLFYDRARNPYIDRHPPLAGRGWDRPQLWTPIPGTALRGSDRPKPPQPWPGPGGANIVNPIPSGDGKPPVPTIVGYTPSEAVPISPVPDKPAAHRLLRQALSLAVVPPSLALPDESLSENEPQRHEVHKAKSTENRFESGSPSVFFVFFVPLWLKGPLSSGFSRASYKVRNSGFALGESANPV